MTRWLSLEPAAGFTEHLFDAFGTAKIALRLVPHVWLVGGYSAGRFLDEDSWSAGVRLAWRDSSGPRRPGRGARVLPSPSGEPSQPRDAPLSVGQTLKALRLLQLQIRPLAGAPEIADLPAGTTLLLKEKTQNHFGTWWRVSAGEKEGWIRESELNGRGDRE